MPERRQRSGPRGRRRHGADGFTNDGRAVTPAVGKALEAALVVLFVAAVGTTLFGGVVPEYRTAVADEVAGRTASATAERVAAAVPPGGRDVDARRRVDLPATIRGTTYRIRAVDDSRLVLTHRTDGVGTTVELALPGRVVSVSGTWHSATPSTVAVSGNRSGLHVRLVDEEVAG
ncbi:MAG: hypothetical protein ABEJ79_11390 [Halolamina sp.]